MSPRPSDIVITGAGLITSLGLSRQEVFSAVCAGRCGMGPMSAMEQPLAPGREGGQALDLPADFEPQLLREVRYLRRAILDAMNDSGTHPGEHYRAGRCALMLGTTLHSMRSVGQFLRSGDYAHLHRFLAGQTLDMATVGMGFEGLCATTCSACSSSLGSIALGVTLLQTGQCDLVVAGGYDTISEYVYGGFNSLRLIADGALLPFSRNRSGMKLAEGYGIVVLERATDASRRGAKSLVTVAGWGESADAHHLTQPHPQGTGAARAMHQAIERAGLSPRQIQLIAAHATGTHDNDAAEYAALASVFEARLPDVPVVGFKSHLGHTLGGAGAVELILSMTALEQQIVPPCANVKKEDIAFDGLSVATGTPRKSEIRATLNTSLGFGGANTSVVLTPSSASVESSSPKLRDVFITGIGALVPGALGSEALLQRLEQSNATPVWERGRQEIDQSELEGLLNARRVRRMSDYVKIQLAAATLALRDARVENAADFAQSCSAILGTFHGSSNYCLNYYGQIVREGIDAANPMLFAEGVPNAGAAQLSLMLGLKGACQTIIGTRTSGLDALNLAAARIASGAWDRAIVGAAEEDGEIMRRAFESSGLAATGQPSRPFEGKNGFVTGAGGAAIVLESENSLAQRNIKPQARVSRWSAGKSSPDALTQSLSRVLDEVGLADGLISSACGTSIDDAEKQAISQRDAKNVWTPYGHAPEVFTATPLIGIASVLLRRGTMPAMLGVTGDANGLAFSTGNEKVRSFATLASDFSGCVSCTRVELCE